jgi:hypothetical protein
MRKKGGRRSWICGYKLKKLKWLKWLKWDALGVEDGLTVYGVVDCGETYWEAWGWSGLGVWRTSRPQDLDSHEKNED